jgi:hypothetical protein
VPEQWSEDAGVGAASRFREAFDTSIKPPSDGARGPLARPGEGRQDAEQKDGGDESSEAPSGAPTDGPDVDRPAPGRGSDLAAPEQLHRVPPFSRRSLSIDRNEFLNAFLMVGIVE